MRKDICVFYKIPVPVCCEMRFFAMKPTAIPKKKGRENMQKIICNRLYDTETAELVKKVTEGYYGHPAGYEETLYRTQDGYYFLYINGGETSIHPKEDIRRMSKQRAEEFIAAHS